MSTNLLNRYVWLIDAIGRGGERGVTFRELAQQWAHSSLNDGGAVLSKRTFHHQKAEIAELFRIDIVCDRRTNRYTVESFDDDRKGLRRWLIDTFTVANVLKEGESIPERVVVDEVPSAQRLLADWIQAMKQSRRVAMSYHPFGGDKPLDFVVEPYFIKLRSRRWYLYAVAVGSDKGVQLYALDRMESVVVTDEPFLLPADFSPQEHLRYNIGVAVYASISPCVIRIKTYGDKAKYLDALPLHASQRKIGDSLYEYNLCPTPEFYKEILRQGEDLEVVSPPEVRGELLAKLQKITKHYNQ